MASRLVDKRIGSVRVQAFSMAGEETVIILPEYSVAFDVGRAPRELIGIDTVCLSHGHMDHSAGLAYYFSQRHFQDAAPGCVLVQHKLVPAIKDLLQVWGRIEGHVSPGKIVGVDEDEDYTLNRQMVVRPFRVRHPGPTLGFSLVEVRKKLKPEYAQYTGRELADLKKAGQIIEQRVEVPRVAYCADTAIGPYLDHPHVRDAEVLFVEATFFEPDHLERARQGQHTHVIDLPELYQRVRSPNVVLFHVTRRTGIGLAKHILRRTISKCDWDRTTVLMDQPRNRNSVQDCDS